MKICAKCGLQNDNDEACCSECGGTVFKAADAPANTDTGTDPLSCQTPPSGPQPPRYEFVPLSAADRQNDFVTLVNCHTLSEADYAVCTLRAAGIEAFIPDLSLMQWVGWNFNTYGYVRVQISPADYAAAKDLLAG